MADSTALTQTFHHESSTHTYSVRWASIGDPSLPPLIFIHGTPWSSRVWVPYALSLSRNFHVYLYDRPGFGESPPEQRRPEAPPPANSVEEYDSNLARQADVFAALYKSWGSTWNGRTPHVVVHDNAGLLSLRAHLVHGCAYASLCLIDVVAIGPFGTPLFKTVGNDPSHFKQLPSMAFEGILESYIRNAAHQRLSQEDMDALKAPWLRDGGQDAFVRELCQANFRNTDEVEPRYPEVGGNMDVKVIWGAQDAWIGVESAYRLGDALRAKEVVVVEDAGHLIMCDQPGRLGVELAIWLATQAQKSR